MDDKRFMALAETIATFSKDPSTKVGAVVVGADGGVLAMGYNGFPRGVTDSEDRLCNRETKYAMTVHAEMNAVAASAKSGHSLAGATIVVSSLFPCHACAGLIIQAGIKRVLAPTPSNVRWLDSNNIAKLMFEEAGVQIEYID